MYSNITTEIQRLNDYKLHDIRNYMDGTANFLSVLKTELCTNTPSNKFNTVPMKYVKFQIDIAQLKNIIMSAGPLREKLIDLQDSELDSDLEFIFDAFFCRDQDVNIIVNTQTVAKINGIISNFYISSVDNCAWLVASFWADELTTADITSIVSIGVSAILPTSLFYCYNKAYFPDPLTVTTDISGNTIYKHPDGTIYAGPTVTENGKVYPQYPQMPHLGVSFNLPVTSSEITDVEFGPIILENTNNANGSYRVKVSVSRLFLLDNQSIFDIRQQYRDKFFYDSTMEILPQCVMITTGTQFQIEGNGLVSKSYVNKVNPEISDKSGYLGYKRAVILDQNHGTTIYEDEPFYRKNVSIMPISLNVATNDVGFVFYIKDQSIIDNNNAFMCAQYPISTVDDVAKSIVKGGKVYSKYDPLFCVYKVSNSPIVSGRSSTVKYFVIREKDILVPMEVHSDANTGSLTTNPIMNLQFPVSITESNEYIINFPSNLATTRFVYSNAEIDLIGYVSSDVLSEGSTITTARYGQTREYLGLQPVDDRANSARVLIFNKLV